MAQNHVLSYVSCWVGRSNNLMSSCESSWNEDVKIGIGFVSSSNTCRENQQNDTYIMIRMVYFDCSCICMDYGRLVFFFCQHIGKIRYLFLCVRCWKCFYHWSVYALLKIAHIMEICLSVYIWIKDWNYVSLERNEFLRIIFNCWKVWLGMIDTYWSFQNQ